MSKFYPSVIVLANGQFQPVVFQYDVLEPVERAQAVRASTEAWRLAENLLRVIEAQEAARLTRQADNRRGAVAAYAPDSPALPRLEAEAQAARKRLDEMTEEELLEPGRRLDAAERLQRWLAEELAENAVREILATANPDVRLAAARRVAERFGFKVEEV